MRALFAGFFMFCGLSASAQTAPPTKSNIILVQTPDSAGVALRKLAAVFVSQGYTVEKLDREFFTLTLAPKPIVRMYSPVVKAKAVATPGARSALRLSAIYEINVNSRPVIENAQYAGSSTSLNRTAFAELEKVARAYPSGRVSYAKE